MFLQYRQARGKKTPLHSANNEVHRWNTNEIIVPLVKCFCNTVKKKKKKENKRLGLRKWSSFIL